MKKKLKKISLVSICLSLALLTVSCKKDDDSSDDDTSSNTSTQSSKDNNKASNEWDDINTVVQAAMIQEASSLKKSKLVSSICADITVNSTQKTIVLDYGTTGCTSVDGRERKGKINISYTGAYTDSGSVITTTLDDFYVDDLKIEGTKVVTNKGDNTDGDPYYTVSVTGGKIIYTDGDTATWESTRTRTWTEGSTTTDISDDVYEIYGTASGVNQDALPYTMTVDSNDPLVVSISCWSSGFRLPKDGTLTISPEGLSDREIDYGQGGACDYAVKVTIGIFSLVLDLN